MRSHGLNRAVAGNIGGGAVTPADLANLVRWYKVDEGVFADSDGTIPQETDWGTVGRVTDHALGADLIQLTTTAMPQINFATTHTRLHFNGSKGMIQVGTNVIGNKLTFCYVADRPIAYNNDRLVGMSDTTKANSYLDHSPQLNNSTKITFSYAGGSAGGTFNDMNLKIGTLPDIFFAQLDIIARSMKMWNYTAGALVPSIYNPLVGPYLDASIVPNRVGVGGYFLAGAGMVYSWYGGLSELFVTADLLSVEDMTIQGAALAEKWGVT